MRIEFVYKCKRCKSTLVNPPINYSGERLFHKCNSLVAQEIVKEMGELEYVGYNEIKEKQ